MLNLRKQRLEALSLELATETELELVATYGAPDQRRAARALLLERARHLARIAARELTECLHRHPL
jgi:hypothetical protein